MQHKLSPVVLLTISVLAAALWVSPGKSQETTAFGPMGQGAGYASPPPYVPVHRTVVPGPPIPPIQTSRGASWPGAPYHPEQSSAHQFAQPPFERPPVYDRSRPPQFEPPHDPGYGSPGAYAPRQPQPPYASEAGGPGPPTGQRPPVGTQMEPCEGAQILARVGSEWILASEVLPAVDEALSRFQDQIPAHQLQMQRRLLIERQLAVPIETKLIYLDAMRTIPKENLPQIEKALGEQFEKTEQKKMLKSAKVETPRELDQKLRSLGTSLQRRKQAFVQRALAQSWVQQQIRLDEEVTYDQMLDYYRQHLAEFERPTRARWEELMVRFSNHPSKAEAYAAIARMGNRVRAGVPFALAAKNLSDGTTASEGGARDWTHKGSLVSKVLDESLFGLPEGQLSQVLETEDGLHIIRVTERELGGYVAFVEAQSKIRPKIREQRSRQQLRKYVARLKEKTPVWTIFDEQPQDQQASNPDGHPLR